MTVQIKKNEVKCSAKIKIDNISLTLSENEHSDNMKKGYKW
jgi:hypothetical protein